MPFMSEPQQIHRRKDAGRRRTLYMDGKMGYNIQEGMSSAEADKSADAMLA